MTSRTLNTPDKETKSSNRDNSEATSDLDLLNGNNWLNDVIINKYMDMLMNQFTDIFIFSTFFSQSYFTRDQGYESVARYTKNCDLFEYRVVLFPLLELSHWFLGVMEFQENRLYILDPYSKNQLSEAIMSDHMERLRKLESGFLKKTYENEEHGNWNAIQKSVMMPPSIPEQWDGHNCGVFLLEFSRCLAQDTEINFSQRDMPNIRRRIKREIRSEKIFNESAQGSSGLKRRISNMDSQTCWLNSCLQLVLNGLDHSSDIQLESDLGTELKFAQSKNFINPTNIKLLLQDEIDNNLCRQRRENILTGQQCARDFFIILAENKASWLDLYTLFHHVTIQTLTCPNCKRESSNRSSDLYRELACPPDGGKLRNFLQLQFNCVEKVDFLCEEGCKKRGKFKKRLKFVSEESSEFLLVVLTRGIAQGMNNYNNRITVTDNVTIQDSCDVNQTFEPIAVVKHEGNLNLSGNSAGHYVCDVKSFDDQNWYTTNDESIPKLIPKHKVTRYGYIILYKRKLQKK